MIFSEYSFNKIISGKKTQTRRISLKQRYFVGKTYAIQLGRGLKAVGKIKIKKCHKEKLLDISEEGAKKEGYPNKTIFLRNFYAINKVSKKYINNNYNPIVFVYEFELKK